MAKMNFPMTIKEITHILNKNTISSLALLASFDGSRLVT